MGLQRLEFQKMYTDAFVAQLRKNATTEKYQNEESFDIENPEYTQLSNIYNKAAEIAPLEEPDTVGKNRKRMIPDKNHDFESAVALFEAYKELSPYIASRAGFWVYLSHNELYSYVKKRWSDSDNIEEHWFKIGRRGFLSGLWWAVYCTYDDTKEGDERYWLTKQLFINQTFRTRTFFNSRKGMNNESLRGILSFMSKYPELFKNAGEARLDYIKTYFGRLASTKELISFERDFFVYELEKKMPAIELITDTTQVRHDKRVWNM